MGLNLALSLYYPVTTKTQILPFLLMWFYETRPGLETDRTAEGVITGSLNDLSAESPAILTEVVGGVLSPCRKISGLWAYLKSCRNNFLTHPFSSLMILSNSLLYSRG
jgi:hypothetical protein